MKKFLLFLLLIGIGGLASYAQENKSSSNDIKKDNSFIPDSLNEIVVRGYSKLVGKLPTDNMPILKPKGYFPMKIYRPDSTLIYNMPIAGYKKEIDEEKK